MKYILGLDIGGTNTKFGLLDKDLNIISQEYFETISGQNVLNRIDKILLNNLQQIDRIAISCPGIIDFRNGLIVKGGAIKQFDNFNIKKYFEQKYSIKTFVDNDAICVARSEIIKARELHQGIGIVFTVGTGVGGAITINGNIYRGRNNKSGELGSLKNLGVNSVDTWNTYLSLKSLSTIIPNHFSNPVEFLNCYEVKQQFKDIYENYYTNLALFIKNITWILDPQTIVIGGGISYVNNLTEILWGYLGNIGVERSGLEIKKAKYKNLAGIVGAASMVFD